MSNTYQRNIKFYYYVPKIYKKPNDGENEFKWKFEKKFDVSNWLAELDANEKFKSNIGLLDCIVNIENVKLLDDGLYAFRIYKLRDGSIPSKIKEGEEAQPIDLEPDEYVGEDTTLLYDSTNCILMMQYNRMSIGKSRLEFLMTKSLGDSNRKVLLQLISRQLDTSRFRKKKLRSMEFSLENLDSLDEGYDKNGLLGLVQRFKKYSGYSLSIRISASRKKDDTLDVNNTLDAIEEITDNKDIINRAKIRLRDDDQSRIEEVDLFEDVLHDRISFSIENRTPLSFNSASLQMLKVYKERLSEIKKLTI